MHVWQKYVRSLLSSISKPPRKFGVKWLEYGKKYFSGAKWVSRQRGRMGKGDVFMTTMIEWSGFNPHSGGSRKFWWGGFEAQNLKNSDVFTKIESDFSAELGNSNVFFAQIQVVSKKKKKSLHQN